MPFPRDRYVDPVVPDAFASIEDTAWERQFEEYTSRCECPYRQYGGCVDDLGLPPRGGLYIHPDGRRGSFFRRVRRHDPISLAVRQTAVSFEHFNGDGRRVEWSLKCAGPGPAG